MAISAFFSSSNTGLYGSSRILHALAGSGDAPAFLQALNNRKIPHLSVTLSGAVLLVGVVLNYVAPNQVFGYLLSAVSWIVLWVWTTIMICHFNYWQEMSKSSAQRVKYRLPGAPYTNIAIVLSIAAIAVLIATNGATRVTFYVIGSWLAILTAAYYARSLDRSPTGESN